MTDATFNATVAKRLDVTKDLVIFRVACDEGVPDFLPGQYVALGLLPEAPRPDDFPPVEEKVRPGKLIQRSYSVASAPAEKGYLEFYVAIMQQGSLTPRFMLLNEGDRLHVGRKIAGAFTLKEVPAAANLVFISTGTGIAPFISMLRSADTWQPGRTVTLIHGVRFASDFAYQDECCQWAEQRADFRYLRTVSRPDSGWTGDCGYVQQCLVRHAVALDPVRDHVFICGNPAMIQDVEAVLLPRGYVPQSRKAPEGSLHVEKYW